MTKIVELVKELRGLLDDPEARGEYLAVGDGPSRLDVAAIEYLPCLLTIVEKALDLRTAVIETGAIVPPDLDEAVQAFDEAIK